jgi:hypothetical protein
LRATKNLRVIVITAEILRSYFATKEKSVACHSETELSGGEESRLAQEVEILRSCLAQDDMFLAYSTTGTPAKNSVPPVEMIVARLEG